MNFGSDLVDYCFSKKTVGEGVTLCTVKAEGFKIAEISVSFVMPLGEKASLYALVPNVLMRSSAKYPDLTAIEKKLASLYGSDISAEVSKIGENQVIKLAASCIDDRFAFDSESIREGLCELLFDLIFNHDIDADGFFRADIVESEKRLLCERLDAEIADKKVYARRRCEEIMFSDEAYGISRFGTREQINAATPEGVYNALLEILKEARIFVCVSSSATADFAEKRITEAMSGIGRDVSVGETVFVEQAEDMTYEREQEAVKQSKLVMGFRLGMTSADDGYAARRVMTDLFGGSPHSKLFTVVREKLSLCYYCSAGMVSQKGVMFVQSGIEGYNEHVAEEAILEQLEAIKNGDFTDDDLIHSKKALEDGFKSISDFPESLDSWFMSQVTNASFKYPEEYIEEFNAVTREQVVEAAKAVTLDTVFMLEGTATEGEDDE